MPLRQPFENLRIMFSANWQRWRGQLVPVNKAEWLARLQNERDQVETTINLLLEKAAIILVSDEGEMTLKDLVAHIAVWDERGTGWIREAAAGRIPQTPMPGFRWRDVHILNAKTQLENESQSFAEILARSRLAYQALLAVINELSDAQIRRPLVTKLIGWRLGHMRSHHAEINQNLIAQLETNKPQFQQPVS